MLQRIVGIFLVFSLLSQASPAADSRPGPLTAWQLRALFVKKPTGKSLERLREHVYATFGKKALETGTAKPRIEDALVCWAIAIKPEQAKAGVVPKLIFADGHRRVRMEPIGTDANVFMMFADVPNFSRMKYEYDVGGLRSGADQFQVEHYNPDPDTLPRAKVPKGKVTKYSWKSKIFADTVRDYHVYVPAQYDPKGPPACVMVFQDGSSYLHFRTATTLDNLIERGEIPVIIGIFIDPGVIPGKEGAASVSNRSVEYDTLSDKYARFLRDEILPEVSKKYKLRTDAASRAICGISSGGICAFTVAWEMPDMFHKVLSHVGSFTNIRGGHVYPALIRKTARKNIRVFLQAAAQDLDNEHGNWPLANQQMMAALRFKGYDFNFTMGQGFHSGNYATAHMPGMLRWLWRDYRPAEEGKEKEKE